jgi:hypothetical protein
MRVRTRTAPRTQYGGFSAADALVMRGEAPRVVAVARDRNLAQRASIRVTSNFANHFHLYTADPVLLLSQKFSNI